MESTPRARMSNKEPENENGISASARVDGIGGSGFRGRGGGRRNEEWRSVDVYSSDDEDDFDCDENNPRLMNKVGFKSFVIPLSNYVVNNNALHTCWPIDYYYYYYYDDAMHSEHKKEDPRLQAYPIRPGPATLRGIQRYRFWEPSTFRPVCLLEQAAPDQGWLHAAEGTEGGPIHQRGQDRAIGQGRDTYR
jgi:hypothetical protein